MAMKSKTANKLWTPEEDERLKSLIDYFVESCCSEVAAIRLCR
jgi:hypothetical protein